MTRTGMVTVCLTAALLSAAILSSNGTASSGPAALSELAPADEYFGHQHLSPIVIRHRIFALKDDLHHARMQPDSVQHDADYVQDALQDWSSRFPRDPWIAAATWNLATLYEELPGIDAQKQAVSTLQSLRDRFAGTVFAGYAARDLARGVGVRPWPHWAAPTASPAPRDEASLVQSILALRTVHDPAQARREVTGLESTFWSLSRQGDDPAYARSAWELAAAYENLPGPDARAHAIRLLAFLLDRYPSQIYGNWALRDLERGIGERS